MGLRFHRVRPFTPEEDAFLKAHYESEGHKHVATQLDRSGQAVIARARRLGIKAGHRFKLGANNLHYKGYQQLSATHWSRVIKGARKRDLPIDITIEDAWAIFEAQGRVCALTGLPIFFPLKSTSSDGTASLDRIDSSRGYVKGNVQWVHKAVNRMKWDLTQPDFVRYCHLVANSHPLPP